MALSLIIIGCSLVALSVGQSTVKCDKALDVDTFDKKHFTASSSETGHGADQIKTSSKGWCPSKTDRSPWIEIELPQAKGISYIKVTHTDSNNFVSNFQLRYQGINGKDFKQIITPDGPKDKLQGTLRHNTTTLIRTYYGITPSLAVKRLRIVPVDGEGSGCRAITLTLRGCDPKDLCSKQCQNGGNCDRQEHCSCPASFAGQYCEITPKTALNLLWNLEFKSTTTTHVITPKYTLQKDGQIGKIAIVPGVSGSNTAIRLPPGSALVGGVLDCITQIDKCPDGLSISFWFLVPQLTDQTLISAGGSMIHVFIKGTDVVVSLNTGTRSFEIKYPVVQVNKWNKLSLTWEPLSPMKVWLNNVVKETFGKASTNAIQTGPFLMIGRHLNTITGGLTIDQFKIATASTQVLHKMNVGFVPTIQTTVAPVTTSTFASTTTVSPTTSHQPTTTHKPTTTPKPTTTVIPTTTLVPTKPTTTVKATTAAATTTTAQVPVSTAAPITPFLQLNFTQLKNNKVVTTLKANYTVVNKPVVTDKQVTIEGPKAQCLAATASKDSCLVNLDACKDGFTVQLDLMWHNLTENTLLFGTGGYDQKRPGFSLSYRFGKFRAAASTTSKTWHVSIDRSRLPDGQLHKLTISWSHSTGLSVAIGRNMKNNRNGYQLCLSASCGANQIAAPTLSCGSPQQFCIGSACSGLSKTTTTINLQSLKFWTKEAKHLVVEKVIPVFLNLTTTASPCFTTPISATTSKPTAHPSSTTIPTAKPTSASTVKPTTAAPQPSTTQVCVDAIQNCEVIAKYFCSDSSKQTWIQKNCRKFCGLCGSTTATTALPTGTQSTAAPTTSSGRSGFPSINPPYLRFRQVATGTSQFICTVFPSSEANVGYEVRWMIGSKEVLVQNIATTKIIDVVLDNKAFQRAGYKKEMTCEVRGRYVESKKPGPWRPSRPLTSHLTFIPKETKVTLTEGQSKTIVVLTNGTKELHCVGPRSVNCSTRIQVKLVSCRSRRMLCPDKNEMPDLVFRTESETSGGSCSSVIQTGNKAIQVIMTAVVDFVREPRETCDVDIQVIQTTNRKENVTLSRRIQVTIVDKTSLTVCKSVNDPHITTFDRCTYDNFLEGEFVLFKNKNLAKFEHYYRVHAFYRKCSKYSKATCNCAVAVQSGDDVLVIDRCQKLEKPHKPGGKSSRSSKKSHKKSSKKKSSKKKSKERKGRDVASDRDEWIEQREQRLTNNIHSHLKLSDEIEADPANRHCHHPHALGHFIGKGKAKKSKHNTCPQRVPQAVLLYINGELTPGTRVVSGNNGKEYKIYLPTGAYVHVALSGNEFINIWVYPSPADYTNTEGLCGTWNGDKFDDLLHRYSGKITKCFSTRRPNEFNLSWRVKGSESIYRGVVAAKGRGITAQQEKQCTCTGANPQCDARLGVNNCRMVALSRGSDVTTQLVQQSKLSYAQATMLWAAQQRGRGRRQATLPGGANVTSDLVDEGGFIYEPNFRAPNVTSWPSNWTEDKARKVCTAALVKSSLGEACGKVDKIVEDVQLETIEDCVADIKISGGDEWLASAKDSVRFTCQAAVVSDPEVWSTEGEAPPENITQVLCPNDCSGNGQCDRGECTCQANWRGEDCSLDTTKPVEVTGIQNSICDISEEECVNAIVLGFGFLNDNNTMCKYTQLIWNPETHQFDEGIEASPRAATFQSEESVLCPLPTKSSYVITIERNGLDSESWPIIVQDRDCFSIDRDNGTSIRKDRCFIDETCVWPDVLNPSDSCQKCDISTSLSRWTEIEGCKKLLTVIKTAAQEEGLSSLEQGMIGLGVAVALLIIIGIAVYIYKATRRSTKKLEKAREEYGFDKDAKPKLRRDEVEDSAF